MSHDNEWLDQTLKDRKKAVQNSIRSTTLEELKALGRERFPSATDPWSESYKAFLDEHPKGHYYRAETHEGVEIVYCRDAEKGIWFLPGKGMGMMQPKGLKLMAEIVDAL